MAFEAEGKSFDSRSEHASERVDLRFFRYLTTGGNPRCCNSAIYQIWVRRFDRQRLDAEGKLRQGFAPKVAGTATKPLMTVLRAVVWKSRASLGKALTNSMKQ